MNPFSDFGKVALAVWHGLDTDLSRDMVKLYHAEAWGELLSKRVDPSDYDDAEMYFRDAQAVAIVRKCQVKIPGTDPKANALEKMQEAEKNCTLTNIRFARYLNEGPFEDPRELRIIPVLEMVRDKVRRLMGPCPDWDQIQPRFGPGAIVDTVKGRSTALDKISSRPTTYPASGFLDGHWYETAWARSLGYDSAPIVVRGERFSTVPKNWDIDRTIGVGASLPVYYQLGVGLHLRRRLKRFGIDLETGQALHRQIACEASRRGDSATVDLVSASDTIARLFVRYMSEDKWYQLLDSLRSPSLQVGDRWFRLERFSSMGNGFTFELQTILFLALALVATELSGLEAVPGKTVHVYGDDIIVPTGAYTLLTLMLRWCGFTPNPRKSFASGPFRESCGGDYWNGEVVRPYFQKELPRDPSGWISLANGLRRVAMARWGSMGPLLRAWFIALDHLPSDIRKCRGPTLLGDLVIHDDPSLWQYVVRRSQRYFRVWRPVNRVLDLRRYSPESVLAYALAGYPSRLIPRDSVAGYRFGRVSLDVTSDAIYSGPGIDWESITREGTSVIPDWLWCTAARKFWPRH